jgi:formate hydrogenlyase subunit 3/multisubunit Na+/H+ antiporter MnhD subunit
MSPSGWEVFPIGAGWHPAWRLDGPAAPFLITVLLVPAVCALAVPDYLRQPRYRDESGWRFGLAYLLFVIGMVGTVLAADLVLFLVCWEVMTLASYLLIAHETRDAQVARAAFKYFFITHAGTGCLLLAFVLVGVVGGSFAIDRLPLTLSALSVAHPGMLHVVLGLSFLGFATKAGLYPFGDWLPDAHPAAPAPVSAVLSGVMVKLGLYGLLRVFVEALAGAAPDVAAVWGWVIGSFGLASCVVGGAAACVAVDAKVLLAYSSIAQSGFIATGFGAALVLAPTQPALATLALLGAGFLILGDAVVKSLLFLDAGALQWRTGSRRLEDLGGLFQAMPVTGWTALIGSLAIAGFPPLTAFTGKWLLLQATVLSHRPLVSAAGLATLIASLLSVMYAMKFFAACFANRPMRPGYLDAPPAMRAASLILAGIAVLMGVFPGWVLAGLAGAWRALPALAATPPAPWGFALWPASGAFAPVLLLVLAGWGWSVARLALGRPAVPAARSAWMGGVAADPAGPRIHPSGFYSPIRETLARVYHIPSGPRLPRPAWVLPAMDLDHWLYEPVLRSGRPLVAALRRLHTGIPNLYIAWQLAGGAVLALSLLWLLLRRGGAP